MVPLAQATPSAYVVDAAEACGGVGLFDVPLGVNYFWGEGRGEEEKGRCVAISVVFLCICEWPPSPSK